MHVRAEALTLRPPDCSRRTAVSGEARAAARPATGRTPGAEELRGELESRPTFECLLSSGLTITFDENVPALARFLLGDGVLSIGRGLDDLLDEARPDSASSHALELAAETVGRWALARRLLALSSNPCARAARGGRWEECFAVRPILHAVWAGRCGFEASWVRALLRALLDDDAVRRLTRLRALRRPYGEWLKECRSAVAGGVGADGFRAVEERRFVPPDGKRIAYFRQSADGFVLPVFKALEDFKFVSKYNSSELPEQHKAHRIRTSGVVCPAAYFESSFSADDLRRAYHVPLEVRTGRVAKTFTPYFDALPAALRETLGGSRFLVTARAPAESSAEGYSLLMYGAPMQSAGGRVGTTGRTGVLFMGGLPVVVEVDGFEYLLEVKGAGSPDGGYPLLAQRANNSWGLLGALRRSYAEDEFDALGEPSHAARAAWPQVKAVCLTHVGTDELIADPLVFVPDSGALKLSECGPERRAEFRSELGEKQSILLRLTPGAERLSYLPWSAAFDRADTSAIKKLKSLGGLALEQRITCYGRMIARLLKDRRGHLSAHAENILAGSFGAEWQDYADAVALYQSRAHHAAPRCSERRYLTLCVLNNTFYYVARTAKLFYGSFGVGYGDFSRLFYEAFAGELFGDGGAHGETARQLAASREPLRLPDGRGVTEFLWDEYCALDNFVWCTRNFDLPAEIFPAPQVAGHAVAPRLAQSFLRGEVEFLSRARAVAVGAPAGEGREWADELDENLCAARRLLRDVRAECEASELLLPYLKKSEAAPLARRPHSWAP